MPDEDHASAAGPEDPDPVDDSAGAAAGPTPEAGATRLIGEESDSTRVVGEEPDATRGVGEEPDPTRVVGEAPEPESGGGGAETLYAGEPTPSELASSSVDSRQLAPGTVLFGEYEILDVLGTGGMGEVYRARHRRLDETRAIKVMHPAVAGDPTAAEFFDREAKALLSVRSESVVHCHDLLSDAEGRVYLVMEMIDGISLADRIARGGALSVEEVRTLAARVGRGLAAAHKRGVIHRDLSPDNIILPGGRPEEAKLIDFGIAKVLAAGQETILEGFKGKLTYASPEQLGFFEGRIDGRSDVYSLGLVLYAAATGAPLPMGHSIVEAVDARRQLVSVPEDCPAALRAEIDALLRLHPEDRPESLEGRFGGQPPREASAGSSQALRYAGASALLAGLATAAFLALRPGTDLVADPVAMVGVPDPANAVEGQEPAPERGAAEAEAVTPKAAAEPAPPRRASARDRLRILGLLRGGQAALERNALMSPKGESAYDKFQQVLGLDPRNREARAGIESVAGRYIQLARSALERGELDRADEYLANARKASPSHPELAPALAAARERRAGTGS